jgi:uncharacterized membrane protein
MLKSLTIAKWEMRRIWRSKPSLVLIVAVPAVLSLVTGLAPGFRTQGPLLLGLTVALGWFILYMRAITDRATGFADGLEASPAAGASMQISRLVVGLVVTFVQVLIFCGLARAIAWHG